MAQLSFRRCEEKYFLPANLYEPFCARLREHMVPDAFGSYTICNIYFDTPDYTLARRSLEKPIYKEKLRLRSYGVPGAEDTVFLEIKKKYDGIVYKRRETLPMAQAASTLLAANPGVLPGDTQIWRELSWFMHCYRPEPKVYIAYDREALSCVSDSELRITFDRNIRWRDTEVNLSRGDHGQLLLSDDRILMEIKIPGVAPLWLCHLLAEFSLFPTSFSKYGACYKNHLMGKAFSLCPIAYFSAAAEVKKYA